MCNSTFLYEQKMYVDLWTMTALFLVRKLLLHAHQVFTGMINVHFQILHIYMYYHASTTVLLY